jgi:hypothetical protein
MRRSQIRDDEPEGVDLMVDPTWGTGASTVMTASGKSLMTSLQACSAGDVTRQALQLASSALQIDLAWHAGMVSAEAAMECLHNEIGETVRRRNASTRAGSPDAADFFQPPPGTPTGLINPIR